MRNSPAGEPFSDRLSRQVTRRPWLWVAGWAAAALLTWVGAPRIPILLADDSRSFLPSGSPSQQAVAALRAEFPGDAWYSRAAIVFVRPTGLTASDREYVAVIAHRLHALRDELGWQVQAVAVAPHLETILESPDRTCAVVAVNLPALMLTQNTVNRVRRIQTVLSESPLPGGLGAEVTGDAAIAELLDANVRHDVDATTIWAFIAVSAILLFIYRSPVAMLLPLVTTGIALMLTLGGLGRAASHGFPINGLIEMFIIVIVVGCGVDYCLFLFARFREELNDGAGIAEAVQAALTRSTTAIIAGAGTNVVGLAALYVGRNRDLYTSGPTIALAIALASVVVLTFTPALMLLIGRRLLWPMRVEQVPARMLDGRAWRNLARFVTTRPAEVVAAMLLVLVPMALVGWKVQPTYDSLEEFPADSPLVRGAELYARHFFNTTRVSEMTLLVSTTQPWGDEDRLQKLSLTLDRSAQALRRRFPVLFQRDLADPLGNRRESAAKPAPGILERLALAAGADAARKFYVGPNGASSRIDLGLGVDPRSAQGMDMVEQIRATVHRAFSDAGIALSGTGVTIVGESATYCDIRALQRSDFQRVAVAAFVAVFTILVLLVRSVVQALILIGATLLAYLSAYGATWAIFHYLLGTTSISYQIDFLLFIVMLSLGQDYNIYLVTRLREELAARSPRRAVELAIRRTGRVVSGCGVIMAAAFGSMYAGSLLVMQQFAVALALGILVDTFVIRPLLVPALLLLFGGLRVRVPGLAGAPSAADAHAAVGGS